MSCLKRLDEENLIGDSKDPKVHFSKLEIDWLGYNISQSGFSPLYSNTSAILSPEVPKTLKKLQSFLGSAYYISKLIPSLVQYSHPLCPILK